MQALTYILPLATIMVDIITTAGTMVIDGTMDITMVTVIIMETGTVIIVDTMATAIMVIADIMATATMVIETMVTATVVIATMATDIIANRDYNGYW
jgi:hypothetical protein